MTEYDPASDGWTPMDANPLPAGIGVPWRKRQGDQWHYGLLTRADHANPAGAVHGGILAVFADHTLGCYVEAAADGAPNVTIQLNTHFLAAVDPGSFLELRGEVTRATRHDGVRPRCRCGQDTRRFGSGRDLAGIPATVR